MKNDETTDGELMRRVQTGDRGAFASLIERHQEYVRKVAFRMVRRWDVADDLAQETFLRVYRAAASYKPTAAFSTWLYQLVLNLCRDWYRSQQLRFHHSLNHEELPDRASSPGIEQEELGEAVRQAVSALPERQQEVVILHRYMGLSHRQIAEIVDKSESAVESYLVRAYANLRKALQSQLSPDAPQEPGSSGVE